MSNAALTRKPEAACANMPFFSLVSENSALFSPGIETLLPQGGLDTLAQRAATFFDVHGAQAVLAGALPFSRAENDYLFQPLPFAAQPSPAPASRPADNGAWTVTPEPAPAIHGQAVEQALELMARAERCEIAPLSKVVLSRSLNVATGGAVTPAMLLARLSADPSVTAFCTPLPPAPDGSARALVGATPELLLEKTGALIRSHPLAGSARRGADAASDRENGEALLRSAKDQREHRAVTEAIADTLAPLCTMLHVPPQPSLRATASMWHLGTPIAATLRDRETPVAQLLSLLHPTPAVCGMPRERAAQAIADLEQYDRGFYAGAVGWMNGAGDGKWFVSIRCAEVGARHVRLYAGGGIVPGSDPLAEIDETSAKFMAMLGALGIDEHGRPL